MTMRIYRMLLLIGLCVSSIAAQQQFIQTVTKQNTNCNSTCSVIDVPELNGNPSALMFITPTGNTRNRNPHPIAAYYMYLKKWSVFNMDSTTITEGSTFNVEWYADPDVDRFVYVVPQRVHTNDLAYIDREGLNFNPNAQLRIFPTTPPGRGAIFNRNEVKIAYDPIASKWYVANVNGTPLGADCAFNIFISSPTSVLPRAPTLTPGSTAVAPVQPVNGDLTAVTTVAPTVLAGSTLPPGTPMASPTGTPIRVPLSPVPKRSRWTLWPDVQPTIAPNAEILLFIHGMDSRAE